MGFWSDFVVFLQIFFEQTLDPVATIAVPVVAYLVFVAVALMSTNNNSISSGYDVFLRFLLMLWNYGFAVFSMMLFMGLFTKTVGQIQMHGFKRYLCDGELLWTGNMGCLARLMMLSKFIELGDTFFLWVRGKPILFLHWYHHASVLLYCWFTVQTGYPSGAFGTMNCFVHSVMYYYYGRVAQGGTTITYKLAIAKWITQIQIIQMVVGLLFAGALMGSYRFDTTKTCDGGKMLRESGMLVTVFMATGGMYLSYLLLFLQYYARRWYTKSATTCTKEDGSAKKEK